MKHITTQKSLRIIGTVLLNLIFYFHNQAQCVLNGGSSAPDVTLQCTGGTGNRTGLAFNPGQNLYYSVNAGSSTYPIETFGLSGGSALSFSTQNADYRGYWWNSSTGEPEGNTVAGGGLYSNSLNGSFYASSVTSSLGAANMPSGQSCGAGDLANNQVIYYYNGYIYKYSRSTGLISSSVSISGLPVTNSNLNSTSVIYTGISGKEAGVYDYVNKCVYLINYNTGAYVSTYTLPASAPANSSYKFSFCNNRVFLYNSATSEWFGYYTVITGTGTQTNVTCNGFDNAVAQITPTNGTGPYSYTWSPSGGSSNTASDIAPGTYTVYMSDANGCVGSSTFVITEPSVLLGSTVALSPLCNGGNGSATVVASGGTAPYTYSWSTGATSSVISQPAGIYTAKITDANSCVLTKTVSITQPSALVTNTAVTNVLCNGGNGSATVTASGGTAPYTYSWSTGATASVISAQSAGAYTVTVTDVNNCNLSKIVIISQPSALTTNTAVSNALCYGTNGSATITGSGGTAPYTYLWTGGGTASVASLPAGTYTATVTDANNCSSSKQVVLTEPTAVTSAVMFTSPLLCNGTNATVTLNAMGGTGALTCTWSTGSINTGSILVPAGNYSVLVKDANNCSDFSNFTITQPPLLVTNTAITNPLCYMGIGSATATASGGTAPYVYTWSSSSSSWSTSASVSIASITAGFYTITVTDANACTNTVAITLYQPPALMLTVNGFSAQCYGGYGQGDVFGTGGTGAFTYSWSNGANTTTTSLLAGNYTVTVTDANNCSSSATVGIIQPLTPLVTTTAVTNVLCNGGLGTASLSTSGGKSNYTYAWSSGTSTNAVASFSAGVYTATITDAYLCKQTVSVTITQPSPLVTNMAATNAPCFASYGSATVTASGGTAPYTYTWSNGMTVSSSTVFAGTYTAVVKDANNCTSINTVVVTQPTDISPNVMLANAKCYGGLGGATLTPSGGTGTYSVVWFNGLQGSVVSLSVGAMSYTVYDSNGCMSPGTVLITQPTALTATIQQLHSYCTVANSTVTVLASGGTGPYTCYWTGASGTSSVQNLAPGLYSVQVVDANNCSTGGSFSVSPPSVMSPSVYSSPIKCYGGTSTVTLNVNGGQGPFTFTYSGTTSTSFTANLPAGTHTLVAKDGNNCIKTLTLNITQPPQFSANISFSTQILCHGGTASVAVTGTGGVAPYTYTWSNSASTGSMVTLASGSYVVVMKDANACTSINQFAISEPALLTASVSVSPILCYSGTSTVNVIAGGGTPAYAGNGTFTVHAGNGTVTVTDANGCSTTAQYSVSQPALISSVNSQTLCTGESIVFGQQTLTATGTYTAIFNAANTCDSLVTLNLYFNNPVNVATGQNGNVLTANAGGATYQWINCETNTPLNGETNQSFNVTQDGSYAVVVTENGCTDTSACMIYTTATVGLKTYNQANHTLRVYPNPVNDILKIETGPNFGHLKIFNLSGQLILESKEKSISVQDLAKGLYLLQVFDESGRLLASKKFVRE